MAIVSFADKDSKEFFIHGNFPKMAGWAQVKAIVKRKLDMLHYAVDLRDLRSPPGNRLESLTGALAGSFSIRVNDQWRITFEWPSGSLGPLNVKICDYH